MAYQKKGYNEKSLANLTKGMATPKLMYTDSPSQRLANEILEEKIDFEGKSVTVREAIIRVQVERAVEEGDLRACQFLIELAGRNEANAAVIKTAATNPLDQLQSMMRRSKIDDRRKKAD